MAKFASIVKGTRARKRTTLTLRGQEIPLDVRVLGFGEDVEIATETKRLAKAQGETDPVPGDVVYDHIERAALLVRACIDCDSPEDAPAPFFQNVAEVLDNPDFTRDHVAFLVEEQARWQDQCSPLRRKFTVAEYVSAVAKIAEGDIGPFAHMPPGMQWLLVHSLARQQLGLPTHSLLSSPSSAATPN